MPPRTTLVDEDGQPCYFRSDEDDTREYYHYEEPSAKHLIQVIKEECGYEIWEDELWRKHVKNWVPCEELNDESIPWEEKKSTEDEWQDFQDVFEDGAFSSELAEFTYSDVPMSDVLECMDLRILFTFLLEHHLDVVGKLLDLDYAHVGQQLFPWSKRQSFDEGGCRQSLLGMAVFDAQSPNAVNFLLNRGANPNGMLNRMPCTIMGPQYGPEAIAINRRCFDSKVRIDLLQALVDGGGDPITASLEFDEDDGCVRESEFLTEAILAMSKRAMQRWHNVLAMVQIISFWRHFAARPESKAVLAAAARFDNFVG